MDPAQARAEVVKPLTVDQQGFSLNAAVACPAGNRTRLERLCRYVTRPAIALERVSLNRRGEVLLALKRPYRDGTTHLRFTPQDFLARLAALVPRPRANLTRYHGVFAPAHPWRRWITGARETAGCDGTARRGCSHTPGSRGALAPGTAVDDAERRRSAPLSWAERVRRVFGIEITVCLHCGGKLRVIADVTDPEVIARILEHVRREGLPRTPPAAVVVEQLSMV